MNSPVRCNSRRRGNASLLRSYVKQFIVGVLVRERINFWAQLVNE
jgi:hypothetical protein